MTSPDDELIREVLRRVERPVELDDAASVRVLDRTLRRYEERQRPRLGDADVELLPVVPASHLHALEPVRRSLLMMAASLVLIVAIGFAIASVAGRDTDDSQQPVQDTAAASAPETISPSVVPPLPEPTENDVSTTDVPDATVAPDSSDVPTNLLGLVPFTTRSLGSSFVDGNLSYRIRTLGAAAGARDGTAVDVRLAASSATDRAAPPHPVRTVTVNSDGTVMIPLEMLYPTAFGGPCEGGTVVITTTTEIDTLVEAICAGSPVEVRVESSIGGEQSIDGALATPVTYEITPAGLDPAQVVWWFDGDRVVQMTYTVDGVDVDLT